MTDTNKLKIKGIYEFVNSNNDIVINELSKISYNTIINYKQNYQFFIAYEHFGRLRIHTKKTGDNSSQAHVYISNDNTIQFLNRSKIVMDIIIDTHKKETRDIKLKQLLDDNKRTK